MTSSSPATATTTSPLAPTDSDLCDRGCGRQATVRWLFGEKSILLCNTHSAPPNLEKLMKGCSGYVRKDETVAIG